MLIDYFIIAWRQSSNSTESSPLTTKADKPFMGRNVVKYRTKFSIREMYGILKSLIGLRN